MQVYACEFMFWWNRLTQEEWLAYLFALCVYVCVCESVCSFKRGTWQLLQLFCSMTASTNHFVSAFAGKPLSGLSECVWVH